jgi:hypothetical protein
MMRWKFSSPRLTATQFVLTRGRRFDAQTPFGRILDTAWIGATLVAIWEAVLALAGSILFLH